MAVDVFIEIKLKVLDVPSTAVPYEAASPVR